MEEKKEDRPGSIRGWGSEARRRGPPWMWLNPAAHENLCAPLHLPASPESGGIV